jgi:hypothetical protein
MDLEYNKKQLPSEIAALLPDSVEEFTGDDADARVLAVREPAAHGAGASCRSTRISQNAMFGGRT